MTTDTYYMAGTERTGQYFVICLTPRGRIGIRHLYAGTFRVRVEPNPGNEQRLAKHLLGWRQPSDNQFRFSTVADSAQSATDAVGLGLKAMGRRKRDWNPPAKRRWRRWIQTRAAEATIPAYSTDTD